MHTYSITYRYSRDGKVWHSTSTTVRASSDEGAIRQVESKQPYVRDIQIRSIR